MDLRSRDFEGFFGEMVEMPNMIVTSSPIERMEQAAVFEPAGDYPTWSAFLKGYKTPTRIKQSKDEARSESNEGDNAESIGTSVSSYSPIAEHRVKVALTPGHKVRVLSHGTRKIFRQATPGRKLTYSKLNKIYHQKNEEEEENIETIKQNMKCKEALTVEDLDKYERILKQHLHQRKVAKGCVKTHAQAEPPLMRYVEKHLGHLDISPSTSRTLRTRDEEQERRLVSLAITKRRSEADIRKKIQDQQQAAKLYIRNREEQEMKQIRASQLRRTAMKTSTLFSEAHLAHHKRVVKEARQKANVSQLQRKLHSEKAKNSLQATQIVRDVWGTFLQNQYQEMRKEIRQQRQEQAAVVKESEIQLERLKLNYEEKLADLKAVAAAKGAEAGMNKKEITREIDRIQQKMQQQFQSEFQNLLQRIETKNSHKRFVRAEKAVNVAEELKKGNFVYDM